MDTLEGLSPETSLWVEIFFAVLALLVIFFVLNKALRYLASKLPHSHVFSTPILFTLIGSGFLYILQRLGSRFEWEIVPHYMPALKKTLVILVITILFTSYIKTYLSSLVKRAKELGISRGKLRSISRLLHFVVYLIAALLLFQAYGLNIMPILTFGGIGVAALALASQDILSNFFGGIMVFFKRPFYEGDKVILPSVSNFKGTVKEVGLYATIFEDENKLYSYFPNSLFCKSLIKNESRMEHSLVAGIVTLSINARSQLPELMTAFREKLAGDAAVTIDASEFNNEMLTFNFTLSFEKLEPEAFLEKKATLFNRLYDIVSPHEGSVKLTS